MLCEADKLNCRKFVRANDVVKGQRKLNLAYVANLFNNYPALAPPPEEIEGLDELFDNEEDSREERAFRMWINSLGVDPEVSNIFDDLQDGLILLQLIDKVGHSLLLLHIFTSHSPGQARHRCLEPCEQEAQQQVQEARELPIRRELPSPSSLFTLQTNLL